MMKITSPYCSELDKCSVNRMGVSAPQEEKDLHTEMFQRGARNKVTRLQSFWYTALRDQSSQLLSEVQVPD